MADLKLGINLWSQASDWPSYLRAGRRADELGYDHLWTWDHVLAIFGDPAQPKRSVSTSAAGSGSGLTGWPRRCPPSGPCSTAAR